MNGDDEVGGGGEPAAQEPAPAPSFPEAAAEPAQSPEETGAGEVAPEPETLTSEPGSQAAEPSNAGGPDPATLP